jgi:hypothetical protein
LKRYIGRKNSTSLHAVERFSSSHCANASQR